MFRNTLFFFTILLICSIDITYAQAGDTNHLEEGLKQRDDILFYGGFERYYNDYLWKENWGIPWAQRASKSRVITNAFQGGRTLRVEYPTGGVGPGETGMQFPIVLNDAKGLTNAFYNELYLRYYVKFEENFDFALGGKLPGLMGGGDAWSRSNGNQPDGTNGWTLRFMWREEGRIVVYAYVPPSNNGKWGNETWGQDIECDFAAEPGEWICLEQYVNVGTPGKDDGILTVWINGEKKLHIDDMLFWREENNFGRVGGVFFSTFHGGNEDQWAPKDSSYAQFDAFVMAKERVGQFDNNATSIESSLDGVPKSSFLHQNFPNPFNSSTRINFSLARNENTVIDIYNINGQLVKRLLAKQLNAGYHSVDFDASELASGLYISSMKAGNYYKNRKLVLLK